VFLVTTISDWKTKRSLKSALCGLLDKAREHEANGIPPRHQVYAELYRQALDKIRFAAEDLGTVIENPGAEYPALPVLQRLCEAPPTVLQQVAKKAGFGFAGIAALCLTSIFFGWILGVFHFAYHMVAK
jgi:hypothetical protein